MQQLQKQDYCYLLSRKAVLPLLSDCAYLVTSGELIKYCIDADGSTIIVGHFLPGNYLIGSSNSFLSFYVKALSEASLKKVELCQIEGSEIAKQVIKIEELLAIKAKRFSVKSDYPLEDCRLPSFLRWVQRHICTTSDNHFSLEMIGSFLGTSRHVVYRNMKIMYRDGRKS